MKKLNFIIIFIAASLIVFTRVENAQADSTHLDVIGNSFVLGKGGSRVTLANYNVKVILVGTFNSRYIAMFECTESKPEKLVGKLFIVDNLTNGTCTWDGNDSYIINIEGLSLSHMRYIHGMWGHAYMQIFLFDMREHFGDKPNIWAVSNSCESKQCYIFKYKETYDESAKCVKERKLIYITPWNFGHQLKGIDVLDLNPSIEGVDESTKRIPPIFVQVSRDGNYPNGINGDFWCVANHI